jgi:heterotetrameric sarcosine oxidase delta subunit
MLLIPCPYCGPREETEFAYGGEAHIARPSEPETLSDAEWGDYVFMRTNPKGAHYERWNHAHGCRRWFNMMRHTVSHQILAVYKVGDPKPMVNK